MPSRPSENNQAQHYQLIAKAIKYLAAHQQQQPSLSVLAKHIGLSDFHFQRLFSQWVGISPKQYLQFLTKEYAKQCLLRESVMDTALMSGLSGSGRLHDLMVNIEAMTPGEYKLGGSGLTIDYGFHQTPFGECLLASTARGICKLAFYDSVSDKKQLLQELEQQWPQAKLQHTQETTANYLPLIFPAALAKSTKSQPLNILLKGTQFQLKVWEALLRIPGGEMVSYQQVASAIDSPAATRAVASAIAKNNIGYLIPCHRVIRGTGDISQYRWGQSRKQIMLGWEASVCSERQVR